MRSPYVCRKVGSYVPMTISQRIGCFLLVSAVVLAVGFHFAGHRYTPGTTAATAPVSLTVTTANGVETFNYHVTAVSQRSRFGWPAGLAVAGLGVVGVCLLVFGTRSRGT